MTGMGQFLASLKASLAQAREDREAVAEFSRLPLVEACAPDVVAELRETEVVQALCRRVLALEQRLVAVEVSQMEAGL